MLKEGALCRSGDFQSPGERFVVARSGGGSRNPPFRCAANSTITNRRSALIRARTKAALSAKRAKGERTGSVPFGYRVTDGGKLEPDAGEQAVIKAVADFRAAGLTLRAIVSELDRAGLTSRAGKPLQLTQVARILAAA